MYFLYLALCADKSIYTGITNDLKRRAEQHKNGTGGSYTRAHKFKKIVYAEECGDRSKALKREAEIKSWPREKKLALIKKKER